VCAVRYVGRWAAAGRLRVAAAMVSLPRY